MSATGTRNENKYRKSEPKSGKYSAKIDKPTSERLVRYCEMNDLNKVETTSVAINYYLDKMERVSLEEKSKEELIELLLRR